MKLYRWLPGLTLALCVPGVALRAMHLLNGFDVESGLPRAGSGWLTACIALCAVCCVLFALCAFGLRARSREPFEQLLGTQSPLFRMAAVIVGFLLIAGGVYYLILTMTTAEQDAAAWARILELVYAVVTVCCGASVVLLAKAQGEQMNERSAKLLLLPLLWSCLHLLVTYRMTCVDPKLPSFAFGLLGDVALVIAFYQLARLLYGKPRPALLGFFGAAATLMSVTDLGGYGLAQLMGVHSVEWSAKMVARGGLSVAACILIAAELFVLASREQDKL